MKNDEITIEKMINKLPKPVKIYTKDGDWFLVCAKTDPITKKYIYQNISHGLFSALDRLSKKVENDIKKGDGFKDIKKWL